MDTLIQNVPSIIEQAAKSPLGIFALIIIALSIIGFLFFREAAERTRIGIFALMFVGFLTFGIAAFQDMAQPALIADTGSGSPESLEREPVAAPADVGGRWTANVRYPWGASYQERFAFSVADRAVSGSASYLGTVRGIFNGTIQGDEIAFSVQLAEVLGEETRTYRNHYRGVVSQTDIRFTMEDDRTDQGNPPIEFVAIPESR